MNPALYDSVGLYLVVLSQPLSDTSKLRDIFAVFWKQSILNVNVLMPLENELKLQLSTYRPFQDGNNCFNLAPVFVNSFENNQFLLNRNQYTLIQSTNFNKCPLRVAIVAVEPWVIVDRASPNLTVTGTEMNVLRFLESQLNFTAELVLAPKNGRDIGMIFPNGSTTGAAKMVSTSSFNEIRSILNQAYRYPTEKFISELAAS